MKYAEVPLILRKALNEKGMTQAEFAMRMNRPKKTINEILQGKAGITEEFAIHCERVLGVLASYLTSAQMREQLAEARKRHDVSHLPPAWTNRRSRKKPGPKSKKPKKRKQPGHMAGFKPLQFGTGDGSERGVGALDARQRESKSWEKT